MAEKRMFAKTIIDSDAFLEMPMSARLLYYDLGMRADDDGFVNSPKKIMRIIGATNDDMNILIMRKFIIPFDNGVVVIKHWRINNYLRKDRYVPTKYKEQKALLSVDDEGKYHLVDTDGIPSGIPVVDVDKNRIEKNRIESSLRSDSMSVRKTDYDVIIDMWNELDGFGNIKPIRAIGDGSKRRDNVRARLKQYGIDGFRDAIENIKRSDFLQGNHAGKQWTITFDWFVLPTNFPKVLEGNYNNNSNQTTVNRNNDPFAGLQ